MALLCVVTVVTRRIEENISQCLGWIRIGYGCLIKGLETVFTDLHYSPKKILKPFGNRPLPISKSACLRLPSHSAGAAKCLDAAKSRALLIISFLSSSGIVVQIFLGLMSVGTSWTRLSTDWALCRSTLEACHAGAADVSVGFVILGEAVSDPLGITRGIVGNTFDKAAFFFFNRSHLRLRRLFNSFLRSTR